MSLRYTLRQLEYLVAVGDAGSIALASGRVNVSSPSISAAISQLEDTLGVQIFVRHHAQGLSLTPGGRRIYNEARRILDSAAALHDLAGDIARSPRGPISLGCLSTVAPFLSGAIRRSFLTACPDAQIRTVEAHQTDLFEKLRRAEIDIALTYDLDMPGDIAFIGLTKLPPCVMVAADHPLSRAGSVTLAQLEAEPLILLDLPASRDYFLSMFHAAGLRPNVAERTADLAVARSLVANGFGYGLMNIRPATRAAPDGKPLAFLRLEGDHRPVVLGLARMNTAHASRILTAFQAHCAEQIRPGHIPGIAPPD